MNPDQSGSGYGPRSSFYNKNFKKFTLETSVLVPNSLILNLSLFSFDLVGFVSFLAVVCALNQQATSWFQFSEKPTHTNPPPRVNLGYTRCKTTRYRVVLGQIKSKKLRMQVTTNAKLAIFLFFSFKEINFVLSVAYSNVRMYFCNDSLSSY